MKTHLLRMSTMKEINTITKKSEMNKNASFAEAFFYTIINHRCKGISAKCYLYKDFVPLNESGK